MDLHETMRTTFAAREFTDDPLDDATLYRILDHARFAPHEPGMIYCDDEADAPFATDAGKFAFFCAAAAAALVKGALPRPHVVHVHDWPGALFFLLREFDSRYARLQQISSVFTIHNLALQGVMINTN